MRCLACNTLSWRPIIKISLLTWGLTRVVTGVVMAGTRASDAAHSHTRKAATVSQQGFRVLSAGSIPTICLHSD